MAKTARAGGSGGEAVIGPSTRVRGRVSGDGDLLVEGTVEGDITLAGELTIAEGARGASNVEADAVTIRGELEGDIRSRGLVRVEANARVRGDVHGDAVVIVEGAEFAGRLEADFELPAELGGGGGGKRR